MLPAASPIKISLQTEATSCPYLALLFSESRFWSCSTSFNHVREHFCSGFLLLPPLPARREGLNFCPEHLGFSSPCALCTGSFQVISYRTPVWLGHRVAPHQYPKNHGVLTPRSCRAEAKPLQSNTGLTAACSIRIPPMHVLTLSLPNLYHIRQEGKRSPQAFDKLFRCFHKEKRLR